MKYNFSINPMLKDEVEKNQFKKRKKNDQCHPKLTHQSHDPSYKTEIIS